MCGGHMKKILRQKQIDTLYHFTQAKNLDNIFRYGIVPRAILDERRISSCYNDEYRYDDCLDAVCTSIEFPNYKMFYKLRQDNREIDWAVLKLDANILCDFKCAFCWTNAGDASVYDMPLEDRMGKNAFLELFEDKIGYPQRKELGIYDWYPTNPQAEVLVFGIIPIEYIKNVYFENYSVFMQYRDLIPKSKIAMVNSKVYAPRIDWTAWKG